MSTSSAPDLHRSPSIRSDSLKFQHDMPLAGIKTHPDNSSTRVRRRGNVSHAQSHGKECKYPCATDQGTKTLCCQALSHILVATSSFLATHDIVVLGHELLPDEQDSKIARLYGISYINIRGPLSLDRKISNARRHRLLQAISRRPLRS